MKRHHALGLIASAAVVPAASSPLFAQSVASLKVATTPIDGGAQPFYATDMGFFKANALDVTTQLITNGAATTAAVLGGAVDVAQANLVSLALAHQRGLDVVVIAPASLYSSKEPNAALVVAKTSPYQTAKDLNGQVIAVNGLQNISQIGPEAWLDKNGGNLSSYKWTDMPFTDMIAAINSGHVAAALIAEPVLSDALANGSRVLGYPYDAIAPTFLVSGWFTTGGWAKKNPAVVKRFQKAMVTTAMWANKNHAQSALILSKDTKITVTPGMKRSAYGEKLDPALMQPLIDVTVKYGALKSSFPAIELIAPETR
ncbi:MAG TPA: ABC transporter substrate-binding protein [Chloroflexota bacterium]|nr:ABC transporter substrate-binding protein [Chloroflexota bacterium]